MIEAAGLLCTALAMMHCTLAKCHIVHALAHHSLWANSGDDVQTEREKASAVDMHTTFQQELVKLRLKSAQAYYKVLTDGQVGNSSSSRRVCVALTLFVTTCVWH